MLMITFNNEKNEVKEIKDKISKILYRFNDIILYDYILENYGAYIGIYMRKFLYYDEKNETEVYDQEKVASFIEQKIAILNQILDEIAQIPEVEMAVITNTPGLMPYWGPKEVSSTDSKIYSLYINYKPKTMLTNILLSNLLYRILLKIAPSKCLKVIPLILIIPFHDIRDIINTFRPREDKAIIKEVNEKGIIISLK